MGITVTYHHENGTWWADSEDVAGFYAAAQSLAEARREVRDGLQFHFDTDSPVDFDETSEDGGAIYTVSNPIGLLPWAQGVPAARLVETAAADPRGEYKGANTSGSKSPVFV